MRIVDLLDHRSELSVAELAAAVGVSGEDASHHLAVLRRAGVVQFRRDGKKRFYTLTDDPAIEVYLLVAGRLQQCAALAADEPELL